jgi:hypothetical protein
MTKATKSLLTASIVFVLPGSLFTSGLVNVENLPALYVLLPTGVVFLGLALLSKVLEKEMAHYDQEHAGLATPAPGPTAGTAPAHPGQYPGATGSQPR